MGEGIKVKYAQLHLTLCDPMDYIVYGLLQARILQWVAFPFSRRSSQPRDQTQVSLVAGRILYQLSHKGSPYYVSRSLNICLQMPFLNTISGHMRRELDWENSQGKIY